MKRSATKLRFHYFFSKTGEMSSRRPQDFIMAWYVVGNICDYASWFAFGNSGWKSCLQLILTLRLQYNLIKMMACVLFFLDWLGLG